MSYSITRQDLEFAHSATQKALGGIRKFNLEKVTGQAVQSTMVAGTTFAFGFLSGYAGSVDVLGVPVDLGVGILCQLGAYAGVAGASSKALHDIGDGALASYFAKLGAGLGDKFRRQGGGKAFGNFKIPGMVSGAERRRVTDTELAAMAASVRA